MDLRGATTEPTIAETGWRGKRESDVLPDRMLRTSLADRVIAEAAPGPPGRAGGGAENRGGGAGGSIIVEIELLRGYFASAGVTGHDTAVRFGREDCAEDGGAEEHGTHSQSFIERRFTLCGLAA